MLELRQYAVKQVYKLIGIKATDTFNHVALIEKHMNSNLIMVEPTEETLQLQQASGQLCYGLFTFAVGLVKQYSWDRKNIPDYENYTVLISGVDIPDVQEKALAWLTERQDLDTPPFFHYDCNNYTPIRVTVRDRQLYSPLPVE